GLYKYIRLSQASCQGLAAKNVCRPIAFGRRGLRGRPAAGRAGEAGRLGDGRIVRRIQVAVIRILQNGKTPRVAFGMLAGGRFGVIGVFNGGPGGKGESADTAPASRRPASFRSSFGHGRAASRLVRPVFTVPGCGDSWRGPLLGRRTCEAALPSGRGPAPPQTGPAGPPRPAAGRGAARRRSRRRSAKRARPPGFASGGGSRARLSAAAGSVQRLRPTRLRPRPGGRRPLRPGPPPGGAPPGPAGPAPLRSLQRLPGWAHALLP